MEIVQTRSGAGFRYEAELVDALEPALADLTFRAGDSRVLTFREVPAARGVPDLTAVRFDFGKIGARHQAGIRPLTTDVEVRVVFALSGGGRTVDELCADTRLSRDYLRRSVLPMLEQLGWMQAVGPKLLLRPAAEFVGGRVVTVEAKLRDWLRAFNQARHQQVSADAAYIALDAQTIRRASDQVEGMRQRGIGVILVDPANERRRVVARPSRVLSATQTRIGRALIAERCLSLYLRGERAGQVSPVFGWYPPRTNV
ncbi:hypothetical protein [Leifsonia poae]|uniref:hypothetical protein n=1 Tax=Leifsonia poae TaxID=110933 RepID=UPI001CBB279A|nr:hypothetical protein [Leifsonia poae]